MAELTEHTGPVPYLAVEGAARAIDFYTDAFGAEEVLRLPSPDGTIGHAELRIFGGRLYLSDREGGPALVHAFVPDVARHSPGRRLPARWWSRLPKTGSGATGRAFSVTRSAINGRFPPTFATCRSRRSKESWRTSGDCPESLPACVAERRGSRERR